MRILAIERDVPGVNPKRMLPHLRKEAAAVWALTKSDVLRGAWFTVADHRAVLMLECAGEAEGRQILDSLPLVQRRLIDFDVCTLRPYDGFERLFSSDVQEAGAQPGPGGAPA